MRRAGRSRASARQQKGKGGVGGCWGVREGGERKGGASVCGEKGGADGWEGKRREWNVKEEERKRMEIEEEVLQRVEKENNQND